MRNFAAALLMGLLCIAAVGDSYASDASNATGRIYPLWMLTCPEALLRGCCDTYCPKPQPRVPAFCRGCGCDTYCPKLCPLVPHYCGGCGDRYCAKPCPELCRPIAADYFSCAAGSAGCVEPDISDHSVHYLDAPSHVAGPNLPGPELQAIPSPPLKSQ